MQEHGLSIARQGKCAQLNMLAGFNALIPRRHRGRQGILVISIPKQNANAAEYAG